MLMANLSTVAQHDINVYSIPDKPWYEGFGNHRAVIDVKETADAVELHLNWRHGDNVT